VLHDLSFGLETVAPVGAADSGKSGGMALVRRFCDVQTGSVLAGAGAFIGWLPRSYATMPTERAANPSLGQRQRVSFARAPVTDAPILVPAKATAGIDSDTEVCIEAARARMLGRRTGLVIAHRLATMRKADRITVLTEDGIAESGAHDAPIAQGGLEARPCASDRLSFDDLQLKENPR
jgi:ATP-binding cassette subfamily B protein